jgi:hypothetical protein
MTSHEEALDILARQLHCPEDLPAEERQAEMERALLPLIRCALRSGRGVPRLVRWVRHNRPFPGQDAGEEQSLSLDRVASALSHKLCSLLLEQIEDRLGLAASTRETVVGF